MPWKKGMPRGTPDGIDADVVRPTAIARVIYGQLNDYCKASGQSLRAVIERALVEFLERNRI